MRLRHDHGSQYMSDDFQAEIAFLGMESSPAFVRQPEGNGCAGRFIRTQKEQLLWGRTFQTVEELRQALRNLVSGTPNVGSSSTMVTSPRSRLGSSSLRNELLHESTQFSVQQTWCASQHACELQTLRLEFEQIIMRRRCSAPLHAGDTVFRPLLGKPVASRENRRHEILGFNTCGFPSQQPSPAMLVRVRHHEQIRNATLRQEIKPPADRSQSGLRKAMNIHGQMDLVLVQNVLDFI